MEIVKLWRFSLLLLQYIFASACNCYEMPFLFNWLSRVIFMNFDTFFFLEIYELEYLCTVVRVHTERENKVKVGGTQPIPKILSLSCR